MSPSRGALSIFGAKVYFIVISYAAVFGLTRVLSPHEYGLWFVANGIVSFLGTTLVAATAQSMSHHVSRHADRQREVRRTGLRVHAALGAAVTLGLAALALPIGRFLREPDLVTPLLLVSPIPLLYSLYAAHIGVINGRRQFRRQAGFDTGFATLKTLLMLGGAALGLGALGALGGLTLTALVVLIPATMLSRCGGSRGEPFPTKTFLGFSLATTAFVAAMNLPLHVDALLVERHLGSASVGLYGAALQVARVPYQLCVAITFVVFPFLASADAAGSTGDVRAYAQRALVYALVIGGIPAALLTGSGAEVVPLLVGKKLAAAGPLLWLLGPALLSYTLLFLCCSMLVALGRPGRAVLIAAATAALQAALVASWVRGGASATEAVSLGALRGAATGTLVASGVGCAAAALALWRETRLGWSPRFTAAAVLLGGLAWASWAWKTHGLWVAAELTALGVAGLAGASLLGVIPLSELRSLRAARAASPAAADEPHEVPVGGPPSP